MNFSTRISSVLLVVASFTMILLTVLMHFKYHMTRSNLVTERLNVAASGIGQPIQSAIDLGVEQQAKNIMESLQDTKQFNAIITNISIFKVNNDSLQKFVSLEKQNFLDEQMAAIQKAMRASKNGYSRGKLSDVVGFVGLTLKDVANEEKCVILICYDLYKIRMREEAEVKSLYQRLLLGLILIISLNYLAVFKNTRSLNNMLKIMESSISHILNHVGEKIDLGKIEEPVIKTQMRAMATKITQIGYYINKLDQLLAQVDVSVFDKKEDE